ncbi:HlyD family secretion protein [Sphingomonas oryzagri]|jgi:membrane fusion protein (multidrug efflux system)|uniref:HlyD family secretion protein n=1 Tax=Sphingomonas oryzagri TaxID=3042314 RepID=A0ABT6MZ11_9SPHN|nr:HlyD family secretion protein [Sphingomonas oryzagri]MDH7638202.1 HlyD family secretion protein [Sphingomonas oryzagri]
MADDDKQDKDDKKADEPPKARWPWILAGIVVVVFVIVILLIVFLPHRRVRTDDAYVTAHYTMLAPRVAGQIDSVRVDDNQPVHAGDLVATIDPRDLQTALQQALANRESDRARVDQASAQVARQPALIAQAAAQVSSARAKLALAEADQRRYANLATSGAGTYQQHQQADANLRDAQASVAEAEAELSSQRHQLDGLKADREAAVAQVARDDAAIAQSKLNLDYTYIVAPIDGTIAQKSVQVGNQVTPGAPLMALVPLHDAFIIANFRELELRHMRPGQHARIHLDAYDTVLNGVVASLPPSSGATFSPIPPNNATGNFTKIVQRLPVKIVPLPNQPLARLMRAGMSVEVTVDTQLYDVVGAHRRQAPQ